MVFQVIVSHPVLALINPAHTSEATKMTRINTPSKHRFTRSPICSQVCKHKTEENKRVKRPFGISRKVLAVSGRLSVLGNLDYLYLEADH